MKVLKFKIDFLSPVHIGSGNELEPFNYILYDKYIYRINLEKFIINLESDKKYMFLSLIEEKEYIKLRKFINENCDPLEYGLYRSRTSRSFRERFKENLENPKNALIINSFIRINDIDPYIPGSSIKGSIRTALLNYYLKNDYLDKGLLPEIKRNRFGKIKGIDVENNLLKIKNNNAKFDPFRSLSITDIKLNGNCPILVGMVINKRLENNRLSDSSKSWQMFYEVTNSLLSSFDYEDNMISDIGEIRINDIINEKLNFYKKITLDDIKEACNSFYIEKAKNEFDKFFKNDGSYFSILLSNIQEIYKNQFILRLGKFSQFEFITLDNFNEIKPKVRERSRNILEDKFPLGWIKISIL
jgi:CRISPR-associated protein Csm5